ncbi:MAG: hypothetical protein GY852_04290 [bacterium]|nr:hypothetical protein [bacterium]
MMTDWILISVVAVVISSLLSAIMIMVSRLFQLPTLEQWAKSELIFSLSTVILLMFLVGLLWVVEPMLVDIVKAMTEANFGINSGQIPQLQDADLMDYTFAYMNSVFQCIREIFKLLIKLNFPLELAASFSVDVFMFDLVTGWAYKGPVQTIRNMTNYITFTLFIYYLFIHVMRFIHATALTVFVPLGIILRQFPPTRGSGAFILAFAIGFYLVFPFSYILVTNVVPQTFACPMLPEFEGLDKLTTQGIGNPDKAFEMMLWSQAHQSGFMGTLSAISGTIAGIDTDPMGVIPDAVEIAGGRIAGFSINLCCLPFLAMIITMSFVLSSTNLFGANLPEIGRGFVKLI